MHGALEACKKIMSHDLLSFFGKCFWRVRRKNIFFCLIFAVQPREMLEHDNRAVPCELSMFISEKPLRAF